MIHEVKLSNGELLVIEEGDACLTFADKEDGEVGTYICQLHASGVTAYPNSGSAGEYLTKGLKRIVAPSTIGQRVALRWVESSTAVLIAAGPIIKEKGWRPWRRVLTRFDAGQLSVHTEIFRVEGDSLGEVAYRCENAESFLESGNNYPLDKFDESFAQFHKLLGKQVKL
jgi:hypothetical protein